MCMGKGWGVEWSAVVVVVVVDEDNGLVERLRSVEPCRGGGKAVEWERLLFWERGLGRNEGKAGRQAGLSRAAGKSWSRVFLGDGPGRVVKAGSCTRTGPRATRAVKRRSSTKRDWRRRESPRVN